LANHGMKPTCGSERIVLSLQLEVK